MEDKIKVIIYGLGVIGGNIAKAILEKKGIEITGVIDIDPQKVGKDMGEILGLPEKTGVIVSNNSKEVFENSSAIAVIHTTSSYLPQVFEQIKECIEARRNVISTCEELSFPYKRHTELADKIDTLARNYGVTVVGTGINPGYLMDTLPLVLTAPCLDVKSIKVTRMMNSAKRRIPFQKKVGTGLTPEEFRKCIEEKRITGHVGLLESINMIASGLGWELDETKELPPEPVIAEKEIETPLCKVEPGKVLGLKSIAFAKMNGKEVISLNFIAHAGVEEEYDEIIIEGNPNIHQKILGGVHGDIGTVAVTINTIPKVINASPGLFTMKDLPVPSATPMDMRVYIKK
ncbi:hypothetical protein NLD30_08900 [SCandidatus Aminicenantes bacterium Aminicenantia_JdfR_composite]|jgi:4-hydroxy-tetrahydrodipicolinate reductase|nr:hypothetical protein [SCandidatus Aminicenantes bacterium Aminicenantia_JdfR_composite]MCP2598820.1 hypothetical protein [Candidatus Aminicenantes bacterium AC-335-L06]MCP2620809.1 hypothetical protein [Candidatus Aminicenantes bacterium AC-334-E05]